MERKDPSELHLFSALRTTLIFFDAHSHSTASAKCQIRCSYDITKLNESKERREKKKTNKLFKRKKDFSEHPKSECLCQL